MSKPWIKWFPTDWRADPGLRMCSLGARGLWVELLGYMHEAEPYGHLLLAGQPPSEAQIAMLVGSDIKSVRACLAELKTAQVFSIIDDVMYSRRMVRDREKLEQDINNGKGGGNPRLKSMDKQGVNPPDKAQKPEARSQIPETKGEGGANTVALPKTLTPATWTAWRAHLACKGKGLTPQAETLQLVRLKAHGDPEQVVQDAIAANHGSLPPVGGWQSQKARPPSKSERNIATNKAMFGRITEPGNDGTIDITGSATRVD